MDIFTPITLKTKNQVDGGRVIPIRPEIREVSPIPTDRTQLDLDRDQESNTQGLIDFLEKRKTRRQKDQTNKVAKYNTWIGIFENKGDPQQGVKVNQRI